MSEKRKPLLERVLLEVRRQYVKSGMKLRRMVRTPTYKARLIFASRVPGTLNWDTKNHTWKLPGGEEAELSARHVDSLAAATEFHVDIGGFESPEQAHDAGEKLRSALRLVNAVLGLGLNVPMIGQETPRARLAPHVKNKIERDYGASIVDCVFGLNVLKDGEEFELAVQGRVSANPKTSDYILEAASKLWGIEEQIDDPSKLACELLNSASRDPSPRSAFLVSFLALDLLMERRERSEDARQVLENLSKVVNASDLSSADKSRLLSFLGQWRRTSLDAELERFVSLGDNAQKVVQGESLASFLKSCAKLRHKLAHPAKDGNASAIPEQELNERRIGLRELVMGIVWARNRLPTFTIDRPGDVVTVSEMKLSIV